MNPKDLVVFLENDPAAPRRLEFAAAIARRWQAHLIATFVVRPLALDPHAGFAMGDALTEMLARYHTGVEEGLSRARAEFDALTHDRSFTSEWRVSENETGEALMLHARHASLAVMGPPARQAGAPSQLSLSENLIFASGRPCLLVPDGWPAERLARRAVVGWNGSREATRSIADALPLLREADTVHLVVVPEPRLRSMQGEEPGADMAAHLARQGVKVELEQVPGNEAGRVLLHRCAIVAADLLVMGAIGRPRVSEFVFGGATRQVLADVKVPLLLSR